MQSFREESCGFSLQKIPFPFGDLTHINSKLSDILLMLDENCMHFLSKIDGGEFDLGGEIFKQFVLNLITYVNYQVEAIHFVHDSHCQMLWT